MGVIAIWGPKRWQVNASTIMGIENLSFTCEQAADNNPSTESRATTNVKGKEPFSLSFSSTLHAAVLGRDVYEEIKSWYSLVSLAYVFRLQNTPIGPGTTSTNAKGNSVSHPTYLQLRKVSVSNVKTNDVGRILVATISFDFKEVDREVFNAQMSTSALNVKASTSTKAEKKPASVATSSGGKSSSSGGSSSKSSSGSKSSSSKSSKKKTIKVGSYVKPTGKKYATGETIPSWVKQRSHKVSQIKESQNKVLLGHPNGINSWVYLDEVTLVNTKK